MRRILMLAGAAIMVASPAGAHDPGHVPGECVKVIAQFEPYDCPSRYTELRATDGRNIEYGEWRAAWKCQETGTMLGKSRWSEMCFAVKTEKASLRFAGWGGIAPDINAEIRHYVAKPCAYQIMLRKSPKWYTPTLIAEFVAAAPDMQHVLAEIVAAIRPRAEKVPASPQRRQLYTESLSRCLARLR